MYVCMYVCIDILEIKHAIDESNPTSSSKDCNGKQTPIQGLIIAAKIKQTATK